MEDRSERDLTLTQCERDYGTSELEELNRLLADRAAQATDGNGDQWAERINAGIRIVTVVY